MQTRKGLRGNNKALSGSITSASLGAPATCLFRGTGGYWAKKEKNVLEEGSFCCLGSIFPCIPLPMLLLGLR